MQVASEQNQHWGGKASLNPEGLGWDEVLGEGRYCRKRATYQLGVWRIRALYKLPLAPAAKSFDARCILQASSPAVLLCKTVYNQLHCVQKKNTHSHFVSYLHEWCVDLNKNCSEYT